MTEPLDLAALRQRHVTVVCSCGGRRWVHDENSFDPDRLRPRTPGDGLTPCGFCNVAGWETPENAPTVPTCALDDQTYPCDAAALLSEIESLRRTLETILPTVKYAETQAAYTFDPLVRDGLAGGKREHARMVKAGIAGTPSALTLKLREAIALIEGAATEPAEREAAR